MDRETYNLLEERVRHLELLVGNSPVIARLAKLKAGLQAFLRKYSTEHPSLNFEAVFDLQRKYARCEEGPPLEVDNSSKVGSVQAVETGDSKKLSTKDEKKQTEISTRNNGQLGPNGKKAYIVSNYEQIRELLVSVNELFKLNFNDIIDSKFPTIVIDQHSQLIQFNKILQECLNSEVSYLTLQSLSFAENYLEVCLYYNKQINSLQKSLIVKENDVL